MNDFEFKDKNLEGGLSSALYYAKTLGWKVVPLHTPTANGLCSCNKLECESVGKHPRTIKGVTEATTDEETIRRWWRIWCQANIGVATGADSGIFALDVDPRHGGDKSLAEFEAHFGPLPETLTAKTGGGGQHIIFAHPGVKVKNIQSTPDKPGVLGPGLDIRGDGGYIVAPSSLHKSGNRYEWQNADAQIIEAPKVLLEILTRDAGKKTLDKTTGFASTENSDTSQTIPEGSRNSTLTSLAGSMRNRGMTEDEILAALLVTNSQRISPPLSEDEVTSVVRSVSRYEPQEALQFFVGDKAAPKAYSVKQGPESKPVLTLWPTPNEQMFNGLAGEFIRLIEPHTEADPVAILAQFLTIFGNIIGRSAHFKVEADKHFLNLFVVLVGRTAGGRKGTAWGQALRLFNDIDEDWKRNCIAQGLSTGEGLITAVRDEKQESKPVKQGGIVEYELVVTDAGVADKRLLVVESEFASVLSVQRRDGNTLSTMIRQAWDIGNLRTMTKNNPIMATDAHISIVGHITKEELQRSLSQTESFNGYVNRILWFCAQRSKILPEGGQSSGLDFTSITKRLSMAVDFARGVGEMKRDEEARKLWHKVYPKISDGQGGLIGAITARGAAQVIRLSCIYALLDCSEIVRVTHLRAALAVWDYCEKSARFVFGEQLGSRIAEELIAVLRSTDKGLTKTEINNHFGRNLTAAQIGSALSILREAGLAESVEEKVDGQVRAVERWLAEKPLSDYLTEFDDSGESSSSDDKSLNSYNSLNSYTSGENSVDEIELTRENIKI